MTQVTQAVKTTESALHLGIVPDGNRRWARSRGLLPWNGHEKASDVFTAMIEWCVASPDVAALTLWVFSTENWKRDEREVTKLMELFQRYLREQRLRFLEQQIRVVHAGRRDRIPVALATLIEDIEAETNECEGFTLQIGLDYGGKDEIVRSVERTSKKGMPPSEESIRAHLDHPEIRDIDLVIRTSGEMRTSNFFLWQSAYAEWWFTDKLFPDLTTEDLATAIADYRGRKRRYGS